MQFDFDPRKSKINLEKHGISLEHAKALWNVPHVEIQARTQEETRFMIIGELGNKIYSCVYTLRGKVRLISARKSREKEEQIYHEHIGKKN